MTRQRSDLLFLLMLWVSVSALNFGKAFHIDDTFHLYASQQILLHPGSPMSGWVNWRCDVTPMYIGAQPPLFYYLIALVSALFGPDEFALHGMLALFTFGALYWFRGALRTLTVKRERKVMVLFAFFPVFVTGQNVMMDVPLLALLLCAFVLFVRIVRHRRLRDHFALSSVLSVAMMMKYSALPILVLHPLIILFQRDRRALLAMLVPITVLGGWSLWNVEEFGFVHVLAKSNAGFEPNSLIAFLACFGALSTVTLLFCPRIVWSRALNMLAWGVPVLLLALGSLVWYGVSSIAGASSVLQVLFFVNGALLFAFILIHYLRSTRFSVRSIEDPRTIAFLFAFSISAFIMLFAQYIASRYILLIYPFLILMGVRMIDSSSTWILRLAIAKTMILGVLLGISDLCYANFYRDIILRIPLPGKTTVWTAGHWGWQWYAEKAGMHSFSATRSKLKQGDLFIRPMFVDMQCLDLPVDVQLEPLGKIWESADNRTFVSVKDFASLYNSSATKPVWDFSDLPIDTILIYRIDVGREAAITKLIMGMRNDSAWYSLIQEKARVKVIPVDTMLRMDAVYLLDQEDTNHSLR